MVNKYWENEEAIVTKTKYAEVHYYKDAGKLQLYGTYTDKDGELRRTKAAVWDNNEMEENDALLLAYAIMQGLIDVGLENDAFADAYSILHDAVEGHSQDYSNADDENIIDTDAIALDDQFDDETVNYEDMTIADLKAECKSRNLVIAGRAVKSKLIQMLKNDDNSATSTGENTGKAFKEALEKDEEKQPVEFVGKMLTFKDGVVKKTNRRVRKVYLEWGVDAQEWAQYMGEEIAKVKAMPTKTQKQKDAQNKVYNALKDELKDWIDAWDDKASEIQEIVMEILAGKGEIEDRVNNGIVEMLKVIDDMEL